LNHCCKCNRAWTLLNSQFTEKLPTRAFLLPMEEDDELEVELSKGNTVTLKYKAISELQPNGTRCPPLFIFYPRTLLESYESCKVQGHLRAAAQRKCFCDSECIIRLMVSAPCSCSLTRPVQPVELRCLPPFCSSGCNIWLLHLRAHASVQQSQKWGFSRSGWLKFLLNWTVFLAKCHCTCRLCCQKKGGSSELACPKQVAPWFFGFAVAGLPWWFIPQTHDQ